MYHLVRVSTRPVRDSSSSRYTALPFTALTVLSHRPIQRLTLSKTLRFNYTKHTRRAFATHESRDIGRGGCRRGVRGAGFAATSLIFMYYSTLSRRLNIYSDKFGGSHNLKHAPIQLCTDAIRIARCRPSDLDSLRTHQKRVDP